MKLNNAGDIKDNKECQDSKYLANIMGKCLLITGATQGIGYNLALTAAKLGAQVILLDKSIPALEKLYDEVMKIDNILEPFLLPVDMAGANLDNYLEISESLGENITKLDGIIHNAAHFSGLFALLQTPPEDLIKQVHINYLAPIWLTQSMLSLLKRSTRPTLLFADHKESYDNNTAYYNTYAGAKIALMQAVKQLSLENENINLYTYGYNTGWVNTALARKAFPNASNDWLAEHDVSIAHKILMLFNRQVANGSIINL